MLLVLSNRSLDQRGLLTNGLEVQVLIQELVRELFFYGNQQKIEMHKF